MGSKFSYDDDDILEHVPLTPEDVEWLLDRRHAKALHKKALPHFLSRVLATARELRSVRQNFDLELQRRVDMHSRTSSTASNLSPLAAARYLSADQLTELFDAFSKQRLQILDGQRQSAQVEANLARTARKTSAEALASALAALEDGDTARAAAVIEDALTEVESLPVVPDPDPTVTGLEAT